MTNSSLIAILVLTASTLNAAPTKTDFSTTWKSGLCYRVNLWNEVTKQSSLDLPETKTKPVVRRHMRGNDPLILVIETGAKDKVVNNAWMGWEGRTGWQKLPIDSGTGLADLETTQICVYPEGHYFDIVIPDPDPGVNPRDCTLNYLYQFQDPKFVQVAKRCN